MRRILVATLVLIPVLAQAQASTSTEPKLSQASATLVAKATPPAPLASSNPAAPAAGSSSADVAKSPVQENLTIRQADLYGMDPGYVTTPVKQDGTVSDSFAGDGTGDISVPRLIHVVQTNLEPQELATASDVRVHLTVDRNGVPQNLSLDHATDPVVAKKTLEAVSQYRFKPATLNYIAVPAEVTIDVKIQK